jgi:hypothetical protein
MSNLQRKESMNPHAFCGSQVERIEVARQADQCVKWLIIQGFEVLYMQKGLSCPRVIIRNSPLCKSLDGAVHMYQRGLQGERRYYFAIRFDCEVRWADEVRK